MHAGMHTEQGILRMTMRRSKIQEALVHLMEVTIKMAYFEI